MLDLFPRDVFLLICEYLSITELVHTSGVCKTIYTLISASKFRVRILGWKTLAPGRYCSKSDIAYLYNRMDMLSMYNREDGNGFYPATMNVYFASDDSCRFRKKLQVFKHRRNYFRDCCKVDAINCLRYQISTYPVSIDKEVWKDMIAYATVFDSKQCLEYLLPLHSYRPDQETIEYLRKRLTRTDVYNIYNLRLLELKEIYDKTKGIL